MEAVQQDRLGSVLLIGLSASLFLQGTAWLQRRVLSEGCAVHITEVHQYLLLLHLWHMENYTSSSLKLGKSMGLILASKMVCHFR